MMYSILWLDVSPLCVGIAWAAWGQKDLKTIIWEQTDEDGCRVWVQRFHRGKDQARQEYLAIFAKKKDEKQHIRNRTKHGVACNIDASSPKAAHRCSSNAVLSSFASHADAARDQALAIRGRALDNRHGQSLRVW